MIGLKLSKLAKNRRIKDSYMYILKFPSIDCSSSDMFFKELVERCQTLCPMGSILPCPFDDDIPCDEITVEDWKNVFQEVKE